MLKFLMGKANGGAVGSVRQVATACRSPNFTSGDGPMLMTRTRHISKTSTPLQLVYGNWRTEVSVTGNEIGLGVNMIIKAAIEYNGVNYPVTWNTGASTVSIATMTESPASDPGPSIPAGAAFFVRTLQTVASGTSQQYEYYVANTGGFPDVSPQDATNGENAIFGATIADQTTGLGAIDATGGGTATSRRRYGPVAIVGQSNIPAVLTLGTSIGMGYRDIMTVVTSARGIFDEAIVANYPSANYAQGSSTVTSFNVLVNSARRRALAALYFTSIITDHPYNDLSNAASTGDTAATIAAKMQAFQALFGIPVHPTTVIQHNDSTDSWATTGNETVATWKAVGDAYNDLVRAGIAGLSSKFEIADVLMTARNSGIIRTTGSAFGYLADGTHPTSAARSLVASSGAIPNGSF